MSLEQAGETLQGLEAGGRREKRMEGRYGRDGRAHRTRGQGPGVQTVSGLVRALGSVDASLGTLDPC